MVIDAYNIMHGTSILTKKEKKIVINKSDKKKFRVMYKAST